MFDILVHHLFFPLNEWREKTHVLANLRALNDSQYVSATRLEDIRWGKLQAILQHAYQHVPFYRQQFSDFDVTPNDIRSFEDLRRLPLLTKDDIVNNLDRLKATNIPQSAIRRSATGGSTGRHTPLFRDKQCLNIKRAAEFRFDLWSGWRFGERMAYVWPAIQDMVGEETVKQRLRRSLVNRSLLLYAGSLDEPTLSRHARALARYRPRLIRAFPNPLAVLAKFLRNNGRCSIHPAAILTTGEPLLLGQRRLFEQVFGCPVFDCYASRECGHHACECEAHDALHINAECLYLEFERDGKPVLPGEPGTILITDFDNYGMPLIRYRIEDMASPVAGDCVCGRTLPRMAIHAGRISDFLLSPKDGSLISGASMCHYLLAEGPDVGQLQIIQDCRDHLTIRVKSSNSGVMNTEHVEEVVSRVFCGTMRVTLQAVNDIPHEKSGKYRFCINRFLSPDKS